MYLLRRISRAHLKMNCPQICYCKFVSSAVMHIVIGYLFLINVTVILIYADAVVEIFYDVSHCILVNIVLWC